MSDEPQEFLDENHDDDNRVFCPDCNCEMLYGFDYEIENDLLYEASGHYDGIATIEWFECPGCGYIDK